MILLPLSVHFFNTRLSLTEDSEREGNLSKSQHEECSSEGITSTEVFTELR